MATSTTKYATPTAIVNEHRAFYALIKKFRTEGPKQVPEERTQARSCSCCGRPTKHAGFCGRCLDF